MARVLSAGHVCLLLIAVPACCLALASAAAAAAAAAEAPAHGARMLAGAENCTTPEFWNVTSMACENCTEGFVYNTTMQDCVLPGTMCLPGLLPLHDGTCGCPNGELRSPSGGGCLGCPPGFFMSPAGQCELPAGECMNGLQPNANGQCTCPGGAHRFVNGAVDMCITCPVGMEPNSLGVCDLVPGECSPPLLPMGNGMCICPANQKRVLDAQGWHCTACPAGFITGADFQSCVLPPTICLPPLRPVGDGTCGCPPGFELQSDGSCRLPFTICLEGYLPTGNGTCELPKCPPGFVLSSNFTCELPGAECRPGYVATGYGDCAFDECPDDPNKVVPGPCGCGVPEVDSDNDGVPNCNDTCPHNATKTEPGKCGCNLSDIDSDGDGALDNCAYNGTVQDQCPHNATKVLPGKCGCNLSDIDSDGDGALDNCAYNGTVQDACPSSAIKVLPGKCGCNLSDIDSDGDGALDNCAYNGTVQDQCPHNATKVLPGKCGCNLSDIDSDGDGALDNCAYNGTVQDQCVHNATKVLPGKCGCNISDIDSDGDGALDGCAYNGTVIDGCPSDPNKTTPGACGCGKLDTDTDKDGKADCEDECPADANKQLQGVCGCGKPDVAIAGTPYFTCQYTWISTAWSTCSAACGLGETSRVSKCVNATSGATVPHAYCGVTEAPLVVTGCRLKECSHVYVPGAWGSCSASCGMGTQTRSLSCVNQDGQSVPHTNCAAVAIPDTTAPCWAGVCPGATANWHTGAWSACDASCGAGTQTRAVTCRLASGATTFASDCAGEAPASSQSCVVSECEGYAWAYSGYGSCSATCNGGTQSRSAFCVGAKSGLVVAPAMCSSTAKGQLQRTCNLDACPRFHYTVSAWSSCSAGCGGGVSSRTVTCVDAANAGAVVSSTLCAGVAVPAVTKACNSQACTANSWAVSAWSTCAGSCAGVQQRTVGCYQMGAAGFTLLSNSSCPASTRPVGSQACKHDAATCGTCSSNADCGGRGNCTAGTCVCADGYSGAFCQRTSKCGSGVAGVVDSNGQCCAGVLTAGGSCCSGSNPSIDRTGACCPAGNLDACGVCGGTGKAVDAVGVCCSSRLDAAGLCCTDAAGVDECGVCGGQNSCKQCMVLTYPWPASSPLQPVNDSQVNDAYEPVRLHGDYMLRKFVADNLGKAEGAVVIRGTSQVTARRRRLGSSLLAAAQRLLLDLGTARFRSTVALLPGTAWAPNLLPLSSLQDKLMTAPPVNSNYSISSVSLCDPEPVCGNGLCEFGERCSAGNKTAPCCNNDCAFPIAVCPLGANGQVCSGRGRCVPGINGGSYCSCYTSMGYVGDVCGTCAPGFVNDGGTCIVLLGATCADGIQNQNEEGVDCGGVCTACAAGQAIIGGGGIIVDDSSGLPWWLILLFIILPVLCCLCISCIICCCRRRRKGQAAAAATATATATASAAVTAGAIAGAAEPKAAMVDEASQTPDQMEAGAASRLGYLATGSSVATSADRRSAYGYGDQQSSRTTMRIVSDTAKQGSHYTAQAATPPQGPPEPAPAATYAASGSSSKVTETTETVTASSGAASAGSMLMTGKSSRRVITTTTRTVEEEEESGSDDDDYDPIAESVAHALEPGEDLLDGVEEGSYIPPPPPPGNMGGGGGDGGYGGGYGAAGAGAGAAPGPAKESLLMSPSAVTAVPAGHSAAQELALGRSAVASASFSKSTKSMKHTESWASKSSALRDSAPPSEGRGTRRVSPLYG